MRRKLIFMLVLFVLFSLQSHAAEAPQPGITPDNAILWKLDVFIERFLTTITLDQEEKIQKSIDSAAERLTEMTKMLRKDKLWAAEKAAQQQREALEDARTYIVYFDHAKTEKSFEQVFIIENDLQEYAALVSEEQKQFITSSLDAEEEAFVNTTFTSLKEQQQELEKELQKKKEETILKLRANGLNIEEITALKTTILQKIDALLENQTRTQDILNETGELIQDVVSGLQEYVEYIDTETEKSISIETQENTAIISDTGVKSKVKVEGEITAIQQAVVEEIYDSLKKEGTKAEIEIEIVELREGVWRIEKEIDGILSKKQQQMLEDFLLSLSKKPAQLRIKIKHDPAVFSAQEDIVLGENEETGDSMSFVIG